LSSDIISHPVGLYYFNNLHQLGYMQVSFWLPVILGKFFCLQKMVRQYSHSMPVTLSYIYSP